MWYSLIDGRSSCIAITHLAWGTLEDIANDLINECNMLIDTMTDGMDEDEIEEEYGDDIAEFKEFEDSDRVGFLSVIITLHIFCFLSIWLIDVFVLHQCCPHLIKCNVVDWWDVTKI